MIIMHNTTSYYDYYTSRIMHSKSDAQYGLVCILQYDILYSTVCCCCLIGHRDPASLAIWPPPARFHALKKRRSTRLNRPTPCTPHGVWGADLVAPLVGNGENGRRRRRGQFRGQTTTCMHTLLVCICIVCMYTTYLLVLYDSYTPRVRARSMHTIIMDIIYCMYNMHSLYERMPYTLV